MADSPLVCSYKTKTLTGNWYEGRQQTIDYRGKGPTRDRVMPFELSKEAQAGLYKTSKQAEAERAQAAPKQRDPSAPSMLGGSLDAAKATIAAHAGVTARTAAWKLDGPDEATPDVPDRFVTSYQRTFAQGAASAPAKTYFKRDMFAADGSTTLTGRTSGRGGARGEFTRWPAESNYGASVFVDEYAKY